MDIKKQLETCFIMGEKEKEEKDVFLTYINTFDDVLTRKNKIAHLTSSALVLNKRKDKILAIHHNIYNSWGWVGGHADGDSDLLKVAIKEAKEETGIKNVKPVSKNIVSIDLIPVMSHYKKNKYIPAHMHLSVAYLLIADENQKLKIAPEENSGVKWFSFDNFIEKSSEKHMQDIYKKMLYKLENKLF